MFKRMISLMLALALCLSLAVPASAANTLGVTFSAAMSNDVLTVSEGDQNLVVTIKASETVTIDSLAATINWASPLELVSVTGGSEMEALKAVEASDPVNNSAEVAWYEENLADAENITDLLVLTFKVPAKTAAGTYAVNVSDMQLANNDAGNTWEDGASVSATLTIEAPSSAEGYTATIAGASTNGNPVRVGETLSIEVGANKDFYATQMKISYPTNLVTFVETENTPYTITDDSSNGTLELAAYGDKKTTSDKFTLTFTATAAGNADFTITEAKFGNGEDAKSETLTAGTCPEALTVEIAKKQYSVTLNKVDNVAIFEGAETVLDGETYTFAPEAATGLYYDYTLPTATYADGTAATVTATETGWSIANVSGNLTITGTRTPKTYDVTWSGDGAADMDESAKDATATYKTDLIFTIPSDIAKTDTTDGVTYGANITIGGTTYQPTVSDKTYTIAGTSITGEIAIEVTKTIDEADKVTVKVEGSTDITINNSTPSSGSVNVDKDQDVVVEVKPEDGYSYEVKVDDETVNLTDNKCTIDADDVTEDTTIEVIKTVNVTGVTNVNGDNKNFVKADEKEMYLIKMPDHIKMQEEGADKKKAYTYDGKRMYWSDTYNTYVITVFCENGETPAITHDKFAIVEVEATPEIEASYDVNQSGVIDANDAQLIWNMYEAWYEDFTEVSEIKFILADANGDEILNMNDATVIINDILNITANQT